MQRHTFFSTSKKESKDQVSYASDPSRATQYAHSDQNRWAEFSRHVMQQLEEMLPNLDDLTPKHRNAKVIDAAKDKILAHPALLETPLGKAYVFLACERYKIAKELQHGKEEGTTKLYGMYRKWDQAGKEVIKKTDPKAYPEQKDAIFAHVYQLTKLLASGASFYESPDFTIQFKPSPNDQLSRSEERRAGTYVISIKNTPENRKKYGIGEELSSIILNASGEDKVDEIIFNYANASDTVKNFNIANEHYLACRSAKTTEEFLYHAGQLSFLLAHCLPVARGNSAVIEWLVRSLAHEKGIELGPFAHDEKIGWDMKAYFMPVRDESANYPIANLKEYAKWYVENAFKEVKVLDRPFERKISPDF